MKLSLALLAILLISCNRGGPQTKEAVRQGVIEHLTNKAGLDVSSMDVEIASVSFRGNEADAMVSFRPRSNPDPGFGMRMKYTLESQRGKWVVKGRAESGGAPHSATPGSGAPPAGSTLPADHPPIGNPPAGQKPGQRQ